MLRPLAPPCVDSTSVQHQGRTHKFSSAYFITGLMSDTMLFMGVFVLLPSQISFLLCTNYRKIKFLISCRLTLKKRFYPVGFEVWIWRRVLTVDLRGVQTFGFLGLVNLWLWRRGSNKLTSRGLQLQVYHEEVLTSVLSLCVRLLLVLRVTLWAAS